MILYGQGHYIYCGRDKRENIWFKWDDENGYIMRNGKWVDLIEEIIKSKLYPVSLIYQKSELAETYIPPLLL